MHPELFKLCKQIVTRYAYIGHDDHNDYMWHTEVVSQPVVLNLLISVSLNPNIMASTVIVKDGSTPTPTTYVENLDYVINYTLGTITRTSTSTIPTGSTVYITYNWQEITTFMAHVESSQKITRDKNGQELMSGAAIYCDGSTVIDVRDKISIPSFQVEFPEIMSIDFNVDEFGNIDHKIIYTKYFIKNFRA